MSRMVHEPLGGTPLWGCWLVALLWAGVAAAESTAVVVSMDGTAAESTVVVVSMDGTAADAAERYSLPTLQSIHRRGARAERLVPVFPSNTFPNHVSLVTGVAPGVHGIVNNSFLDPERGPYHRGADPTWIEVEPIWSWLARHGIVSAAFHWVGSEGPWRSGRGPRYWKAFDGGVGEREKVRQILAWLALDAERPRLVTTWFHGADRPGHVHGPDTDAVREALRDQDAALAELLAGLEARDGLRDTTLLVVSDHGMARVEQSVDLSAILEGAGIPATVWSGGGFATITIEGDAASARRAVALARQHGLEAHLREEAPSELRLDHRRFGQVVVLAPPGMGIVRKGSGLPPLVGSHGYRSDHPPMGALFAAVGRGIPAGTVLGEVDVRDVAPTLLRWLGAPAPDWMEGRPIPQLTRSVVAGEVSP